MATHSYSYGPVCRPMESASLYEPREWFVWEQATAWLALLPVFFISVKGWIETDSSPIAFRLTAMDDDTLPRKLVRIVYSLVIVFLLSTRFRMIVDACRRSKLLLLLPAFALLSVLWSQNPFHTLLDSLSLLLTSLFAVYICVRFPGERLVSFLLFTSFVTLVLCLVAVIVFPNVGIDAFQQDAWRGVFGQRNNCATACTLFLAVGLHARGRGLTEQLMRFTVNLLSVVFIVMSGSRTGWIVAALVVVLTYGLRLIQRIRSLDRILFLMVLAIPSVVVAFLIVSNFNEILAAMDKDPTLTQRTIIWAQVIPSIAKHPMLGYGYSAFWAGLNGESMHTVLVTGWVEGQAQDGYLDILLQLGMFGLIPMIAVFLRGFGQAMKAVERKRLNSAVMLAIVLLPLILIENIGESSLLLPSGVPWLFALTALLTLGSADSHAEEM